MIKLHFTYVLLCCLLLTFCSTSEEQQADGPQSAQVAMQTTMGDIVIELSDKTPQHRDNFIKLAKKGAFDSLLFHRVIEGFVVQGGDPESKNAEPRSQLGSGDLGYTVPAEFDTSLFHKRGAVGAARDGNPARASSAIQFYVVQANTSISDSSIVKAEGRINGWLKDHYSLNDPKNSQWKDSLEVISNADTVNWDLYSSVRDTLSKLAEGYESFEKYRIPESHRKAYREVGGTPFLDQNYTVFGEVIEGMDVIDSIAFVATDSLDRPLIDVRILKAKVVQ